MDVLSAIPGLRQAIDREAADREAAFLSFPEFVCGFPVRPLSLRHIAILAQLKLPFLAEEKETRLSVEHVELFLWVLSPGFTVARGARRRLRRFWHALRFAFVCRRLGQEVVAQEVGQFIDGAFADAPPASGAGRVCYTSWIARFVDLFASEYSWPISQVLDLPMKVALQQERQISLRYDNGAILFNPSDKLRSDFMATLNAERKQN